MSRVPWHLFKDRQPRAHLVAAVLRAAPTAADPDPREAQGVLVRLVRAQSTSREGTEAGELLGNYGR
jgi:hypothetical protein